MKLIETPTTTQSSSSSSGAASQSTVDSSPMYLAPAYMFYVSLGSLQVAMFTECSGIGAKRAFEPIREGGVNDHAHMVAGPMEYTTVTLKRGLSLSTVLWDWFMAGQFDFAVQRMDVTIYQYTPELIAAAGDSSGSDQKSGAIKTWSLTNAFPVSWKLGDLNSASSSLVIESLELAHEGISLITG